jgi:putative redox protein
VQYTAPSILLGHSLGGAAILAATSDIPECRAVITINTPAAPKQLLPVFHSYRKTIETSGKAQVPIAGIYFTITQQFIENLQQQNLSQKIAHLNKPLLILHAPEDPIVDIDEARKIFTSAKYPKSFIALDDADHMLKNKGNVERAVSIIDAWAGKYLP